MSRLDKEYRVLLEFLELSESDFSRFVAAWLYVDPSECEEGCYIIVKTKYDTDNRYKYRDIIRKSRKHSRYYYDENDDSDSTYAYFFFRISEEEFNILDANINNKDYAGLVTYIYINDASDECLVEQVEESTLYKSGNVCMSIPMSVAIYFKAKITEQIDDHLRFYSALKSQFTGDKEKAVYDVSKDYYIGELALTERDIDIIIENRARVLRIKSRNLMRANLELDVREEEI